MTRKGKQHDKKTTYTDKIGDTTFIVHSSFIGTKLLHYSLGLLE